MQTPNLKPAAGYRALVIFACFLAFTGMNRLEMVDVAIWLIEVAIAIIIVPVPDVELAKVVINFGGC